jgi:hypothetical protein
MENKLLPAPAFPELREPKLKRICSLKEYIAAQAAAILVHRNIIKGNTSRQKGKENNYRENNRPVLNL